MIVKIISLANGDLDCLTGCPFVTKRVRPYKCARDKFGFWKQCSKLDWIPSRDLYQDIKFVQEEGARPLMIFI